MKTRITKPKTTPEPATKPAPRPENPPTAADLRVWQRVAIDTRREVIDQDLRRDLFAWLAKVMAEMHAVGDAMSGEKLAGALTADERAALAGLLEKVWHWLALGMPTDAPAFLRAARV